jgi:ubiquitin carboxyl-terminal hydrolase 4/11/15
MPDVTGDHKLTVAGEEAWDAHCLRNRSVVMDTFYGQFKSTCICPICDKVSVSFEPFNHISLEIPQSKHDPTCDLPVLLFSTSSQSSVPVRYAINIDKNACMRDVKVGLSKMTGLSCDRIVLCEVYQHKICEIYTDEIEIRKVDKETLLVGYELDPYSNSTIHTISFQSTFKKISQSEDNETAIQTYSVGYPIFTSFDIDLTCSEVWHHFFLQISYVFPELSDAEIETLFHLKIVDNNGKPRQIFRTSEIESDDACCIVSKTDKKSLTSYLEEDCAESFLFVEIEWNLKNSRCKIHDTHFDIYSTHSSVDNAIGKQRTFDSTITLENCLERFTFPERLDEDNKWYCSLCRKHVRAKKTMELWRLPNILIVHLKRFAFKNSYRREKLETFVHYPLEGLDLEKYCTSDSNQPMSGDQAEFVINDETDAGYDLFGVVNHYGRMGYGHYTAFARRWSKESIDDDWISFDDSSVRRIPKEQVVSANAYMLFYRRRVFT